MSFSVTSTPPALPMVLKRNRSFASNVLRAPFCASKVYVLWSTSRLIHESPVKVMVRCSRPSFTGVEAVAGTAALVVACAVAGAVVTGTIASAFDAASRWTSMVSFEAAA